MEEIADRLAPDGVLTAEEATIREFFITFWTTAAGHVAVLGDALRAIEPPDSVRAQHHDYVVAVDAVADTADERIADIRTRDAADLLTILWEPDEQLEAMEAACAALDAEAANQGIPTRTCP